MKHHDPRQVGEEKVYLAYTSTALFIIERSQDRNSNRAGSCRQKLMQRSGRSAAYWFAHHGLLSQLSYRTQDH
ncbi:mCG147769 [Mus musculus]|nr:mCG147769 [Mus musculus]